MKSWFSEDVFRRVLRNTGMLGVGKAIGALLHLASLAVTARWLGPEGLGILILARSYAQAAAGLAKFQSWQTLIRFGAAPAARHETGAFRDLAYFTFAIDALSGLLGGAAAFLLVPLIGESFGIDPGFIWLAQLYCLVIPLLTSATPSGILRIFDGFDKLSVQSVITPSARLVGLGIAILFGAPLWACVVAWLVSDVVGEAFLWLVAARELRRRGYTAAGPMSARRAIDRNPGIVRYALATNVTASLNQSMVPLFTLAVGGVLGTAAAGVFRIAQIVMDAIAAPAELAMRSLFPEAARLLDTDRHHFWRIIGRAVVLALALGLVLSAVVFAFGPAVVDLAMGDSYAEAGPILQIISVAFAAIMIGSVLETALLALGAAGQLLLVRAIYAACAFGLLFLLGRPLGLVGAALAIAVAAFVAAGGMAASLRLARRNTR